MDHPRDHSRGNQGNAENPDSKDTYIYMLVSTHSSVLNLHNSSAYRSAPNQTPTFGEQGWHVNMFMSNTAWYISSFYSELC